MRRLLLALLVAVVALDTFAAVPKRTITGKVIAPDGLTYAGTINCVLSAPATALDGATSVRVQSTGTLTIASDGTVTGSLVANDITTPVTSYTCTTRINRVPVYTQSELIYLTTGSGTVDWGAISRPGATPYTPVGVAGSSGAVQASNGSGGLADSGVTATAGVLAGINGLKVKFIPIDANQDGTYEGAIVGDYNGDGTLTFADVKSAFNAFIDLTNDGTTDGCSADIDGDGTNESACRTMWLAAGTWVSGSSYATISTPFGSGGFNLRGAGRDATILQATYSRNTLCTTGASAGEGILNLGGDNIHISDLTIIGVGPRTSSIADCNQDGTDGGGTDSSAQHGIQIGNGTTYVQDITVERVRVLNSDRMGLHLNRAKRVAVLDSEFGFSGEHAAAVQCPIDVRFQNSVFHDAKNSSRSRGIEVGSLSCPTDTGPVVVTGNTFYNDARSFWAFTNSTVNLYDLQIVGNEFHDTAYTDNSTANRGTHVTIGSGAGASGTIGRVQIQNNQFRDSQYAAIELFATYSPLDTIDIKGNTFYHWAQTVRSYINTSTDTAAIMPVTAAKITNVQIVGNTFKEENDSAALVLRGTNVRARTNTITGAFKPDLSGDSTVDGRPAAIWIGSDCTACIVGNNDIDLDDTSTPTASGIYVDGADYAEVTGNTIGLDAANNKNGITINVGSDGTRLTGNRVLGGDNGIATANGASVGLILSDNVLRTSYTGDAFSYGVNLGHGTDPVAINNQCVSPNTSPCFRFAVGGTFFGNAQPGDVTAVAPGGYYQSGDSQGLQFFPGQGRARAWALQAKQRNDITSAAGITSPAFAVLGDSVTSWSALSTLTQLRRRYGRTVLGYRNLTDTSIYQTPAETISWTGGTKYSAVDTTPTNLEQFGPCGGSYNWTAAANIHYVVNAPNVANTARIYYYCKTGGGTFSWSIYGGGTTNVNTGGCSNGTLGVTTITLQGSQLLQPGAVIDLAWVSGNVTLYGIETYGVTSVTNEALNHIEPVWCVQPGTQLATAVSFGTNTLLQSLLTTIAPSQVFVAFGTNDAAASVSASTYQTNLTTMVTTVQGALTGATKGDVVLVTPVPVGNGSHAEAYAATMEGYRTATFSVGTSKATSVWDARRWWGTFADMYTLGAYLSDDIHPSNYGRLLWAEAFAYLVGHPGWQPARNNIADTWANDANSAGYVFAAATLSPPDQSNYARVYSSTTITTLNTCNQAYWGREFTLDCHDTATWAIGSAGNIRLVVPFACSGANPANQSITLLCDGNAWVEKGRSPGFSGNYSGANSGTLSNATTWYIPGNGLLTTANSTETSAYVVSPASAVTAASLQCKVGAAVATGTWTFKLRVNGADSALTCSMTSSATSCTDTAHTVAVAAGSWLDYSMVPTSTPTAQTYAACSIVY